MKIRHAPRAREPKWFQGDMCPTGGAVSFAYDLAVTGTARDPVGGGPWKVGRPRVLSNSFTRFGWGGELGGRGGGGAAALPPTKPRSACEERTRRNNIHEYRSKDA